MPGRMTLIVFIIIALFRVVLGAMMMVMFAAIIVVIFFLDSIRLVMRVFRVPHVGDVVNAGTFVAIHMPMMAHSLGAIRPAV